jgi:GntR family transcriptional regulator, transcriptional repressor for pyruvate dehydrogenase complex
MTKAVRGRISGQKKSKATIVSNSTERDTVLLRGSAPSANIFETTVERLGQSIKLGLFKPGQQLPPERELACITGVSRVTVRSAIQVLTAGGFLRSQRGRNGGTFVVENPPQWPGKSRDNMVIDAKAAFAVLDHRLVIESGVAMLAASRIKKEQLSHLRELVGRLGELVENLGEFRSADAQLHIAIAEATGNERLVRQTAELEAELSGLIQMIPRSREALIHSNQQHAQLIGYLANGDGLKARDAMTEHLEGTRQLLAGLLPKEIKNRV